MKISEIASRLAKIPLFVLFVFVLAHVDGTQATPLFAPPEPVKAQYDIDCKVEFDSAQALVTGTEVVSLTNTSDLPIELLALDWAVDQSLSNELMVILDLHEFHAMGADPMANKERFLATWKQLAERYKGCPGEVIFEILNEPNKELTPEL